MRGTASLELDAVASLLANELLAQAMKLAALNNWQPSDPGTKEAMEWVARNKDNPLACDHKPMLDALATALTAAMVRLEEAEKNLRQLQDAVVNPTRRPE